MAKAENTLTVRIATLTPSIDADAYLFAVSSTLQALKELNKAVSEYGSENVQWVIVGAGMSSPIFATLESVEKPSDNGGDGPKTIHAFVSGLSHLDESDTPPPLFSERMLTITSRLSRAFAKGVSKLEYSTPYRTVVASRNVTSHAAVAAQKLELENAKRSGQYVEYGTIEGHLRDVLELSDKDKIIILDEVTGETTRCYFRGLEIEEKVRKSWKGRVSVEGMITADRSTGRPLKMQVEDIRLLRSRSDLPQIEDLMGIDITGGVESSEYVRGLRDDE